MQGLSLCEGQSRSSSLIAVLARVCASTRLTMTAQDRLGPGLPSGSGLPGRHRGPPPNKQARGRRISRRFRGR